MIEIPVLNLKGEKIGAEQLDPAAFGGKVRHQLLKQAVVAYRNARRQGTVRTKSRADVHGSSRKLYRQKGTGRARMGNIRTPVRRGGGHAFAKINRTFTQTLPRRMRRLARDSAILAKATSGATMIVDGLEFDAPKTSRFAAALRALKAERGALVAVAADNENLWKSGRNIPELAIKRVAELNAYDVLRCRRFVLTPDAFRSLADRSKPAGGGQ